MVREGGSGYKKKPALSVREGRRRYRKFLWSAHALVHLARTRRSVSRVREAHMLMRQIGCDAGLIIWTKY